jgi:hypothetical protein
MNNKHEKQPSDDIRALRKSVFRSSIKIRAWSALCNGTAVLLAFCVSKAIFPAKEDRVGWIILFIILAVSLVAIFWKSVVDPQINQGVKQRLGMQKSEV